MHEHILKLVDINKGLEGRPGLAAIKSKFLSIQRLSPSPQISQAVASGCPFKKLTFLFRSPAQLVSDSRARTQDYFKESIRELWKKYQTYLHENNPLLPIPTYFGRIPPRSAFALPCLVNAQQSSLPHVRLDSNFKNTFGAKTLEQATAIFVLTLNGVAGHEASNFGYARIDDARFTQAADHGFEGRKYMNVVQGLSNGFVAANELTIHTFALLLKKVSEVPVIKISEQLLNAMVEEHRAFVHGFANFDLQFFAQFNMTMRSQGAKSVTDFIGPWVGAGALNPLAMHGATYNPSYFCLRTKNVDGQHIPILDLDLNGSNEAKLFGMLSDCYAPGCPAAEFIPEYTKFLLCKYRDCVARPCLDF